MHKTTVKLLLLILGLMLGISLLVSCSKPEKTTSVIPIADLIASSITKTAERNIVIGITNNGTLATDNLTVELYAQCTEPEAVSRNAAQTLVKTWTGEQLASKASVEKSVSIDDIIAVIATDTRNFPGNYDFEARVDPQFIVPESNEDNNNIAVKNIVMEIPDLVPSYINKSNDSNIVVGIKNNGSAQAASFTVELYAQHTAPEVNSLIKTWSIDKLGIKESVEKSVSLDDILIALTKDTNFYPGYYDLKVSVDSKLVIPEFNENNNKTTVTNIIVAVPDLVASYVKKTADRNIVVGITNDSAVPASGFTVELYATCKAPEASNPVKTLVQTFTVDSLASKGSVEKSVSIDDLITVLTKDSKNYPGNYDLQVSVDSKLAVPESNENNNKTTVSNIVIAKAPVPEKAYDYTKVYTAANQSELIKIATDGPLKDLIAAGLDMSKVDIRILPLAEANAEYKKLFGNEISTPLRGVAFFKAFYDGHQEVVVSQGILPQVMPLLVREVSGAYYGQKNLTGVAAGKGVYAQEVFVCLAHLRGLAWLAENGMPLNVSAYEVTKLGLDGYLLGSTTIPKQFQSLSLFSADAGFPKGGAPSSVLFEQMKKFVALPDPTDFTNSLYARTASLDKAALKSDAYWRVIVDMPAREKLSLDVCKAIYPDATASFSPDEVIRWTDGAVFPVSALSK